jgi:hypothetical protein
MANDDDNSASVLKGIASTIRKHVKTAQKANRESLDSFRAIGAQLAEAKAILKRGEFGRWVKAEFGYTKQWSSPLIRLHTESNRIDSALEWVGDRQDTPGTKKNTRWTEFFCCCGRRKISTTHSPWVA